MTGWAQPRLEPNEAVHFSDKQISVRGEASSAELTQHTQQQIYMQTAGSSSRISHCIMQHLGMTQRYEFYFLTSLQCFSRGSFVLAQAFS